MADREKLHENDDILVQTGYIFSKTTYTYNMLI